MALLPVDEALSRLLEDCREPGADSVETVSLSDALGRVLAVEQRSPSDVPPADNSAMDGYALRVADCEHKSRLTVSQRIPAGVAPSSLTVGTAARIFTGAPIPDGADAVVLQEDCDVGDGQVTIRELPVCGQHIRRRGQDVQTGQSILAAGDWLQGAHLGLLAAVGIPSVPVFKRIRVALMSTGDELREPGESLAPGQIYNSNRAMLNALLREAGCDVVDLGIVADNGDATLDALRVAAKADLIISTGGVSVGEEDHVRAQVERLGQLKLWKVAMKPGKPLAYGVVGNTPFIGLPGNPASSFVSFFLFARPYLYRLQGRNLCLPVRYSLPCDFTARAGGRQEYLRARVEMSDGELVVRAYPNQSSGVMAAVSWANALVEVAPGVELLPGDVAPVLLVRECLLPFA